MKLKLPVYAIGLALLIQSASAFALQTENTGMRALPAPGPVVIDGKLDDWDLSGGIFACDDVESQRDKFAVWLHLMYDAKNLYIAAHFVDETPLNNPGQTISDSGFAGDSLQVRIFTGAVAGLNENESPTARISHWTCWQGVDQKHVMYVEFGQQLKPGFKNAETEGAQQAFVKDADGKGYVQELALPWKLLTKDGEPLKAGDKFVITFEPNFTVGRHDRLSVKDNFKAGVTLDRVFTFQGPNAWGWATCADAGHVTPQPVRTADGREFPVRLEHGALVADWTGLVKQKELPGFKPIQFTAPADGVISLNIFHSDGSVARQLLNGISVTKGEHTVKWDGLTTPSWTRPGTPVEPGEYTWSALFHPAFGLRFKGWAANGGSAPWDGPTGRENWGGDHGKPSCCAADGDSVYIGWDGAEAGKAVVCCDLQGNVKWRNSRHNMAAAEFMAVDGGTLYGVNWGATNGTNYIFRHNAKDGTFTCWEGTDTPDLFPRDLWTDPKGKPDRVDGLAAKDGKLYVSVTAANAVMVLDAKSGKVLKRIDVPGPGALCAASENLVYVAIGLMEVITLDPATGETQIFLPAAERYGAFTPGVRERTRGILALTVDAEGHVYVGLRDPDNQVKVYGKDGELLSTIGRQGGRAKTGPWTPDGMLYISGLAVDAEGKLWVTEQDSSPKRVSVWDTKTGKFIKEFFGPTTYGALGGSIDPLDPNVMAGQSCEWRIDPATGRAACLGTITRDGMENSRFGVGANGKLYLAVAGSWAYNNGPLNIYERIGDGDYKLRTVISPEKTKTTIWIDENGDGQQQPNEISSVDGELKFSAWYMNFLPDMTLYSGDKQFKVTGFTACGAPKYDLATPVKMPISGMGSADARLVLTNGDYNTTHSLFQCFDIASGKQLWTYPDNFTGVHGSHNACPPEAGLIRGSYGPTGSVKLPAPLGNVWIIPTNVGEWHVLTERGFYLTRLFQPDPMKYVWPDKAVPGARMDDTPCGMGGEDFGGSATLAKDGKLYLQAGKTGFWNVEVTGLDKVQEIKGGKLSISADDVKLAVKFAAEEAQGVAAAKRVSIVKKSIIFTGDFAKDFAGAEMLSFQKSDDAAVRAAAAWDDQNLYLAWDVKDQTPWTNGAADFSQMYVSGDTVDFQLGTDSNADKNRNEAVLGDLRLSIGNFQGQPTAALYRKVAKEKHPKSFTSGVIKEYVMDSVTIMPGASIKVQPRDRAYVVEAVIPISALDFKPAPGLALRGDFGVTHGDQAGQRTRLRTYWSNQHTGIVDDAVFELMMEPKNWGEFIFKN